MRAPCTCQASVRRTILVEIIKIWLEKVCWVRALGEAALQSIVLEEIDVYPEFVVNEGESQNGLCYVTNREEM
jgi:hypothetical protein